METVAEKVEEETATRRHEVMMERDVRIQEMTDVCGAGEGDAGLGLRCGEHRHGGRELDAVDLRLSELIQVQTQLRSEMLKQQQQIVHVKGFQVDGVTDELRSVVRDFATITDLQDSRIKALEKTVDVAREARNEVHMLKTRLGGRGLAEDAEGHGAAGSSGARTAGVPLPCGAAGRVHHGTGWRPTEVQFHVGALAWKGGKSLDELPRRCV